VAETIDPVVASVIAYLSANQFADAERSVQKVVEFARAQLAREVLKTVRDERVKGDGAKSIGSVIDVYDLAVDDITAALVAFFRSKGIEIDKEGETNEL
jgi:hypothetical protein